MCCGVLFFPSFSSFSSSSSTSHAAFAFDFSSNPRAFTWELPYNTNTTTPSTLTDWLSEWVGEWVSKWMGEWVNECVCECVCEYITIRYLCFFSFSLLLYQKRRHTVRLACVCRLTGCMCIAVCVYGYVWVCVCVCVWTAQNFKMGESQFSHSTKLG